MKSLLVQIFSNFRKRALATILFSFSALCSFAQQNLINIQILVNPPYSSNFEDYVGLGADNVFITLTCSPSANGIQSFYLAGQLRQVGASTSFALIAPQTPPPSISYSLTMSPGEILTLSGSDLRPFFDESRLVYENISQQQLNTFYINKFIPEGDYQICLTAHDYDSQQQISPFQSGCSNIFSIRGVDPPLISNPACQFATDAGHISAGTFQNILFQWNAPIGLPFSEQLSYKFQLMEVPVGMNHDQIFQNTTFIPFEVNTGNQTSFYYNPSHPPLQKGKRYAIRVKAEDFSNSVFIRNNGYSSACSFIYGLPSEIEDFENATLLPTIQIVSGAQLFYFEEYLESTANILRVQPSVNSNTSNITHPNQFTISAKIKSLDSDFEIETIPEISSENLLSFNTSNMQQVMYHGRDLLKAFGNFEANRFSFTGNEQLKRSYFVSGTEKLILPPGQYNLELQLMTPSGLIPVSQRNTFNFNVSYPYTIINESFPPTLDIQISNSIIPSDQNAIKLQSVAAAYSHVILQTRFVMEIQALSIANPFSIRLQSAAENCPFTTNMYQAGSYSLISFNKLICILKQFQSDAFQYYTSTGNSESLPNSLISNGKLQLPAGEYKIVFKTFLKDSKILLSNPNQGISFNTTGEIGESYPLDVSAVFKNPVHGIKYWIENSETGAYRNHSYIRAKVELNNTGFNSNYSLQSKLEKLQTEDSPGFILKLKDSAVSGPLFLPTNNSQTITYPDLAGAFGNLNESNWILENAGDIPLEELFPNGELRLPPGQYKLFIWATNSSKSINLSSPNKFVEFTLGPAFDININDEPSLLSSGKITELYDILTPPQITITKTNDPSSANVKTFGMIRCIEGVLLGKEIKLKKSVGESTQSSIQVILNPQSSLTYTDIAPLLSNGFSSAFEMDGSPIPVNYTIDYPDLGLSYLKLPPGKYELCFQVYSQNLHFELGPEASYCRTFNVEQPLSGNISEFQCDGVVPPEFSLRAIYPAMKDTLPFRLFPFIVQFCPYSDNFRKAEGTFRIHKANGSTISLNTSIDNNWPNGPRIGQYNSINGYPTPRFAPPIQVTEQDATYLPVFTNFNGQSEFPPQLIERGTDYYWFTQIFLSYKSSPQSPITSRDQLVDNNHFAVGMTRPILQEPANNSTIAPGKIKLKFLKGSQPQSLLPPLDIIQTQRHSSGGHEVLTYDGLVNEAYVIQLSRTSEFNSESTILYSSEPVQISTSYREFISRDDPQELVELLYGKVEHEIDLTGSGEYFWRVGWLNNPIDENSGFYLTSPTFKFNLGIEAESAESESECEAAVTNLTFHSFSQSELIGKNICIGKFKLIVEEIHEVNQSYQGFGIIRWMDTPFKVVFTNLKINSNRQVFDGIARCEKRIPGNVAQWIQSNLPQLDQVLMQGNQSAGTQPITQTAGSVVNQIQSISNLLDGKATMPYGLDLNVMDMEGQNRNFIFALLDMEFTKDKAQVSALLDLDIPHLSWLFELASTGVSIVPNGFEGDYTFFLPKDKEFPLNDDVRFAFGKCSFQPGSSSSSPSFINDGTYFKYKKATNSTSAYWEAGLGIKLHIAATEGKLLKEITPGDGKITFQGQSILTAGESIGFIFSFSSGEKFGFHDVPELELSCNDLLVDLSTGANSSLLTQNKLLNLMGVDNYTYGNNYELFKGLYFKEIKGKYKQVLGDNELALKDLLIDFGDGGFYGSLGVVVPKVMLGDWLIKDNELGIKFQKNFKEAYLKGKFPLPISAGDPLSYSCNIKKVEGDNFGLNFSVETGEELEANILMAKLLLQNSSIQVSIPFDDSPPTILADLSGTISLQSDQIPSSQISTQLPGHTFEHLKLSSKEFEGAKKVFDFLYVSQSIGNSGGSNSGNSGARLAATTSENEDGRVHGFGATFSNFGLHVEPKTGESGVIKAGLGVKFDLNLKIGPSGNSENESNQFSIGAGGNIRIVGGNLTYNSSDGFGFELAPSVSLGESFTLSGKLGPVTIKEGSGLSIYKASENAEMGDGINILLGVEIDLAADKISGKMNAKFGNVTRNNSAFKYFGLAVQIEFGSASIPIAPPFNLTGIGGGFAINMKDNSTASPSAEKAFESYTCGSENEDLLSKFKPLKGNHYFYANATGNIKSDDTFKACLEMQASIENARLARFSIFGKGMLMPKENKGIVEGIVALTLVNTESEVAFDLICAAKTNPPIPGNSLITLHVNITVPAEGEPTWFMLLGKPGAPNVISMEQDLAGVGQVSTSLKFYFLMGNDLVTAGAFNPSKSTPELILNAFADDGASGNEAKRHQVEQFFATYESTLLRILGSETGPCGAVGGFAFGAEFALNLDISFLIIYFKFQMMLGFDLALMKYTPGCFDCGPDYPEPGMNNHYALGQLYAGMYGDLGLQIDLWFWKGRASLFNAYIAAMLQGGGPNPWWGKGGVVARGEVLGGLASVNTEFKFSFGTQCNKPDFNLSDIKIINEIIPETGSNNVDVFAVPTVSFNNPVSEIRYTNSPVQANTSRNDDLVMSKLKTFNVDYEDANGDWVQRVFCFALNRFEMKEKPMVGGIFTDFVDYSVGEGRPIISSDGLSARLNMAQKTMMGHHQYRLSVEIEILERINDIWAAPNKNQKARQGVSRERGTETAGITAVHEFTTGESPSSIPEDLILYATPLPNQNNFHPGDVQNDRWSMVFKSVVPSYLNSKPITLQNIENTSPNYRFKAQFKARFIDEDGQASDNVIENFSSANLNWTGSLPKNLKNGKVYRFEIIRTWIGVNTESVDLLNSLTQLSSAFERFSNRNITAGNDSIQVKITNNKLSPSISNSFTQSLVIAYHFRVSQYNRFAEKLQALPLTASKSGDKIIYSSNTVSNVIEPFDVFDVSRFKVFTNSQEEFPPLYTLSFLPQDNRSSAQLGKNGPITYNGGMEQLYKVYRDGFHFIQSNLSDLGNGQGLNFRDQQLYYNNSGETRQVPVRTNPHSEDARFGNQNNMLPYFPSGAIKTEFSGLKGRLNSNEKFKGALSVYSPNSTSVSSATTVGKGNTLAVSGTPTISSATNLNHLKLTVEVLEVVKRDIKLYTEILKRAAIETNRLALNINGNSNQPLLNNNLLLISTGAKNHAQNMPVSIGNLSSISLTGGGLAFMQRLYLLSPGSFQSLQRQTLDLTYSNMFSSLYGFELNRAGAHPQIVTTPENAFIRELNIQSQFARMHHSLKVYDFIFNRIVPNPNLMDLYVNNQGINSNDIFNSLNQLTFRIKYTAFQNQQGAFFNTTPEMPVSGSLTGKGSVQFIKP